MPTTESLYDVFVAYATADSETAVTFAASLRQMGLRVFLDVEQLQPGDFWDDALPAAQRLSASTVLLISRQTERAFYQREEIALAIETVRGDPERKVIPVYLQGTLPDAVPYGLRRVQSLFAPDARRLTEAARAVGRIFGIDPEHPPPAGRTQGGARSNDPSRVTPAISAMRTAFEQMHCDAQEGVTACMTFLDIDGMSQINRRFGPEVGDHIVRRVTEIVESRVIQPTMVRIGSDEFLWCASGQTFGQAAVLASLCCHEIRADAWHRIAPDLFVTASCGIAVSTGLDISLDHWVIRAMIGGREAKRSGGNKVLAGPLALSRESHSIYAYLSD